MFEREESDQLPEEGPGQQVPDDEGGESRDEADDQAGGADESGQQTGNPPDAD